MGGDIYRVGARQGATPPSTPVHEVDPGDTHIYIQSRPLSLPPPPPGDTVACGRPTSQVVGTLARAACSRASSSPAGPRRPCRHPWAPSPIAAQRLHPFPSPFPPDPLPSAAPPIHPSFAANWRMLRAYRDRRPGPPPRPSPYTRGGLPLRASVPTPRAGRPGPRSPTGTHAHDEIPLAHRASRQRPIKAPGQGPGVIGVPCHAMPCWMDGSVAQVHAASPAVRLPSHCHFAAPPDTRRQPTTPTTERPA